MNKSIDVVFETGLDVVNKIRDTQEENLVKAGKIIAKAHMDGHTFFVSGSGHSHTVAEEFYGRAGGLAFTVPIMPIELTLAEHPTKSSHVERLSGYANILIELFHIAKDDVIIIASNSGRNAYPIELALGAKEKGAYVIAITNVNHSSNTTSRHASGKRLMDIADLVIDNCGVEGDSAVKLDGLQASVCPTSSISNAFIVQAISVVCTQELLDHHVEAPIFISLNSDGNETVNDAYFAKYTRQY